MMHDRNTRLAAVLTTVSLTTLASAWALGDLQQAIDQTIADACASVGMSPDGQSVIDESKTGGDRTADLDRLLASTMAEANAELDAVRAERERPDFQARLDTARRTRDAIVDEAERARERSLADERKRIADAEADLKTARETLDAAKGRFNRQLMNYLEQEGDALAGAVDQLRGGTAELASLLEERRRLDEQKTPGFFTTSIIWGARFENQWETLTKDIVASMQSANRSIEVVNEALRRAGRPLIGRLSGTDPAATTAALARIEQKIRAEVAELTTGQTRTDLENRKRDVEDATFAVTKAEGALKAAKAALKTAHDQFTPDEALLDRLTTAQEDLDALNQPLVDTLVATSALYEVVKGAQACIEGARRYRGDATGVQAAHFSGTWSMQCHAVSSTGDERDFTQGGTFRFVVTEIDRGLAGGGDRDDIARVAGSFQVQGGGSAGQIISGTLTPVAWDEQGRPTRSRLTIDIEQNAFDMISEEKMTGFLDGNPFAKGALTGQGTLERHDIGEGRLRLDCQGQWETTP